MRCIILAAGEGIRMRPLTLKTPKPMIKICGKPLLEHIIGILPSAVDELVLVVGYLQDQIKDYFKESFGRFKIVYIVQKEKLGTYNALKLCEGLLKTDERFFLLYADDLHGPRALEKCMGSKGPCLVIDENANPSKFGVVEISEDGSIKNIEEKPVHPKTNLVLTGAQLLTKEVLNFPARRHSNGEYFLTDSIDQMITAGHKIYAVKTDFWLPMGYPEDIEGAEKLLSSRHYGI
ncbi:MAG: NTP transferase domain-containing protein [Candidatus Yanofskybacteria bacterium]|nr:NTP transferase domain-containing protein [Candidatus Yanofskybacteria bacterium]